MVETYKIYSDGGARGNPGPAAYGWLLYDEHNQILMFDAKYLGDTTNNIAEYEGILAALKYFKKNFPAAKLQQNQELNCYLDSELIVKQLNDEYKVKSIELQKIHRQIRKLQSEIDIPINFWHIFRESNKLADRLVNICLDSAQLKS